ncbi:ABC transporter substrate-binding protein [Streptomyces nymphaeiformis]|uniref:ABC-type transport system substrate-binding protein n=1 Tax=Streptomyces nymphaeiformis TaxID=2663842 RepID=A0A7W7TWX7_9ACTN|nr:ABC transporter substrate-binding protein [Streptomyces nymphaeiformis]MBB4980872.1 ABC-type transport system substrate-binding protein [Streptomyces nymphaeiformis]
MERHVQAGLLTGTTRAVVAVGLALATAAACSGGRPGTNGAAGKDVKLTIDTPAAKGELDTVRWNLGTEPSSLDWIYTYDCPPNTVIANVCESPLRLGPDFSVKPGLTEKIDRPDPKTWVYTIRQGVKFHDGSTVTAEDVAYSLNRHLDPDLGSYWANVYANVDSVEVSGAHQVTVRLTKPDVLFNQLLATPPGVVASKAYDALPSVDQDLTQAKKLVQEAGAPSRPIVIACSSADPVNGGSGRWRSRRSGSRWAVPGRVGCSCGVPHWWLGAGAWFGPLGGHGGHRSGASPRSSSQDSWVGGFAP